MSGTETESVFGAHTPQKAQSHSNTRLFNIGTDLDWYELKPADLWLNVMLLSGGKKTKRCTVWRTVVFNVSLPLVKENLDL